MVNEGGLIAGLIAPLPQRARPPRGEVAGLDIAAAKGLEGFRDTLSGGSNVVGGNASDILSLGPRTELGLVP